jgi:uracil-DNA glycosylase
MLVGEAPGVDEERHGKPFIGRSGQELDKMLHEADFLRTECRVTNVTPYRPYNNDIKAFFATKKADITAYHTYLGDRHCGPQIIEGLKLLSEDIARTKPKIIIALGDTALWALTGHSGITKYRGSMLKLAPVLPGPFDPDIWVIPTYHPAAILRVWAWRFIAVQDLRRAKSQLDAPIPEPVYGFLTEPTFDDVATVLQNLIGMVEYGPTRLAVDIETRSGHIDCIGIAWSKRDALCIPLSTMRSFGNAYWSHKEEFQIIQWLETLLTHPNAQHIGQNYLYDMQYIARSWGWYKAPYMDTMIAHATCFPGLPKSLDFLSSLYLPFHRYWKDENKEANKTLDDHMRWLYNCKDCVTTFELSDILPTVITDCDVQAPYEFEMSLFEPLFFMMMKGVRFDLKLRNTFSNDVWKQRFEIATVLDSFSNIWDDVQLVKSKKAKEWYASPIQQATIFYTLFGMAPIRKKGNKNPTCDDEALVKIGNREPLLYPITQHIAAYRSLGVFFSTF